MTSAASLSGERIIKHMFLLCKTRVTNLSASPIVKELEKIIFISMF